MCIIKILTSDAFPLFMKFWGTLDPPPLTIQTWSTKVYTAGCYRVINQGSCMYNDMSTSHRQLCR